jgi:hypothetical protein
MSSNDINYNKFLDIGTHTPTDRLKTGPYILESSATFLWISNEVYTEKEANIMISLPC